MTNQSFDMLDAFGRVAADKTLQRITYDGKVQLLDSLSNAERLIAMFGWGIFP
jgi:hypothetical protein